MVKFIRVLIGLICAVMAIAVLLAVAAILLLALVLFVVAFLVVYVVAPEESKAFWLKVRDQIEDWVTRLENLGQEAKTLATSVLSMFPGYRATQASVEETAEVAPTETVATPEQAPAKAEDTSVEVVDTLPVEPPPTLPESDTTPKKSG